MKLQLFFFSIIAGGLAGPQLWRDPGWKEDLWVDPDWTVNLWADPDWAAGRSRFVEFADAPDACSSVFSCKDCNTARVCQPLANGTWAEIQSVKCPATAPYCAAASGTCSAAPDPTCGQADKFICIGDGRFPDTADCHKYHVCDQLKSATFECLAGQTYDADGGRCSTSKTCNVFDCASLTGVKVPLADTHYYAYCNNDSAYLVGRCEGDYKLNATSQLCEPLCEQDGLMADLSDCTMYYRCSTLYLNATLAVPIRQHLTCTQGEAFDPSSYMCVPSKLVAACTPS